MLSDSAVGAGCGALVALALEDCVQDMHKAVGDRQDDEDQSGKNQTVFDRHRTTLVHASTTGVEQDVQIGSHWTSFLPWSSWAKRRALAPKSSTRVGRSQATAASRR